MTIASTTPEETIDTLFPAMRHIPPGYTDICHCGADFTFRIRNIVATRIETTTHDCWTFDAAPIGVNEVEWSTLCIGSNPAGGAVFYRGQIIDRFIPSQIPGEIRTHLMERAAPVDYEGTETDRHPAREENGSVIRYLADGSMTRLNPRPQVNPE